MERFGGEPVIKMRQDHLRHQTVCHRYPMGQRRQPLLMLRQRLISMPRRVPEIEQLPQTLLCRILLRDPRLYPDNLPDIADQGLFIRQFAIHGDRRPLRDQSRIKSRVSDQSRLQHLCITRQNLGLWQGLQEMRVEDNLFRLSERPHLILQSVEVNTRLSADRRISHRQKRRRNINGVHPPLESGGCESGYIGHGPPADRIDRVVSRQIIVRQRAPDRGQSVERLLSVRNYHHREIPQVWESLADIISMETADC